MSGSNKKKAEILGVPLGTACYKLRKLLLFSLAQKLGENVCFRCGALILTVEAFTIDHKEAWQSKGAEYFWKLSNIAFSHSHCNLPTGMVRREILDGTLWYSKCKLYLEINQFYKEKKQRTGYSLICKECSNAKRRKIKAQGDCTNCGAKRETKPFRVTHNICLSCANRINNQGTKGHKLAHKPNQESPVPEII